MSMSRSHVIGAVTGRETSATLLKAGMQRELNVVKTQAAGRSPVKTLFIVGRQPAQLQNIYAAGPKTYLGQLLSISGAINVAPASPQAYVPVTKEQIISADPAVIIDASLGEAGDKPSLVEAHKKAWDDLPMLSAVKNHRVYYLADPHMTVPGPHLVQTARSISDLLHRKPGR